MAKSAAQLAFEKYRKAQRAKHATDLAKVKAPADKPNTRPAYGTYDPILDQQERSANRGLGYLTQDTQKTLERATTDYGLGQGQINENADRSLADLLKSRERGTQDYGQQTADLGQNYGRLANTQKQQANAAGVLGGAIEQARQKRATNQAHDQSGIDQNYNRFLEDSRTSEGRVGADRTSQLGQLLLGYQRTGEDAQSGLTRAQAENVFYGQDINELRVDQAKQAGLLPTSKSSGSQHPSVVPPKPKKRKRRPVISDGGSPAIGRL
jgi:hypothetical protein